MIRFDLICDKNHEFDGWFASNDAFVDQQKHGLISCPFCQSTSVEKQLMAPGIPTKQNARPTNRTSTDAGPTDGAEPLLSPAKDPVIRDMIENIRKMRQYVSENAENVGDNFARTAREIHYEKQPERPIYGRASPQDAKSLIEEGISVLPLPELPEEKN